MPMMVTITEKDREEAIRCYIRQCSKCAICTPPSFGHCGGDPHNLGVRIHEI